MPVLDVYWHNRPWWFLNVIKKVIFALKLMHPALLVVMSASLNFTFVVISYMDINKFYLGLNYSFFISTKNFDTCRN